MTEFNRYADFYDRLYADKPYADEALYVHQLCQRHGLTGRRLLDLGCGTGRHALAFQELGYRVTGIDRSEDMLKIARQRLLENCAGFEPVIEFECDSIQSYRSGGAFDVVTALFHVMSYQVTDEALRLALEAISKNLRPLGLAIFDFWYTPAVEADPPVSRTRLIDDTEYSGSRKSFPTFDPERNEVRVDFELDLQVLSSTENLQIRESHLMRYFDIPELTAALDDAGLDLQGAYRWMSFDDPSTDAWYACVVARKHA